jgi:Ser/Thr protein kinase RdoA (MazF antagonist)
MSPWLPSGPGAGAGPVTARALDFGALEAGLEALGLARLERIFEGWQSLAVYAADLGDRRVAVKLLDPAVTERDQLLARIDLVARLASAHDLVCAPVPVAGRLLNLLAPGDGADHEPVYAVVHAFAEGRAPDLAKPAEAAGMGRTLAELHAAMAQLPHYDLPELAAFPPSALLAGVARDLGVPSLLVPRATPDESPRQILHGDFSWKNLRMSPGGWRIFDFDDCGYGAVDSELANSLYYVLFGAMTGMGRDCYPEFRHAFLAGYRDLAPEAVPDDDRLDALINRRVLTLALWLADPRTRPIGVRSASDQWRSLLADFVRRYLAVLAEAGPGWAAGCS